MGNRETIWCGNIWIDRHNGRETQAHRRDCHKSILAHKLLYFLKHLGIFIAILKKYITLYSNFTLQTHALGLPGRHCGICFDPNPGCHWWGQQPWQPHQWFISRNERALAQDISRREMGPAKYPSHSVSIAKL